MARVDDERYTELAAWAESDAPTVRPGARIHRGSAALTAGRALLEDAASDDPASLALLQRAGAGRPPLDRTDAGAGPSPVWNLRAPRALDTAMRDLARAQGRQLRDVLRDAAEEYVAAHRAG